MPIDVACDCGKTLRAGDGMAGRRVKCPNCGTALTVPGGDAEDDGLIEFEEVSERSPSPFAPQASTQFDGPPRTPPDMADAPSPGLDPEKAKRIVTGIVIGAAVLVLSVISFGVFKYVTYTPPAPPPRTVTQQNQPKGYLGVLAEARKTGQSLVATNSIRQLLLGIQMYKQINGTLPKDMDDLESVLGPLDNFLLNPRTKENPGYIYVKPPGNKLDHTPVIYEAKDGKPDPAGSVGYLDGAIEVPKQVR